MTATYIKLQDGKAEILTEQQIRAALCAGAGVEVFDLEPPPWPSVKADDTFPAARLKVIAAAQRATREGVLGPWGQLFNMGAPGGFPGHLPGHGARTIYAHRDRDDLAIIPANLWRYLAELTAIELTRKEILRGLKVERVPDGHGGHEDVIKTTGQEGPGWLAKLRDAGYLE